MDVGQVQFQIIADGLDATLEKVTQLQNALNGMDGKKYRAGTSQRAKDENAYNRAVQRSLKNHKQLLAQTKREADSYHKQSEKRIKDALKFGKIDARNKEYAKKKQAEILRADRKALQDDRKRAEGLYKEQQKKRNAAAKAERKRTIRHGKQMVKEWKAEQKAAEQAAKAPAQYQKAWENTLANMGARMQTLGATLQRATSPFMNVYRGLAMGIGYRALGKVMESISGAFSRYDTMKTYGTLLKELGMDTSKKFAIGTGNAMTAVENLEQAVLGLPTGLDEMVDSMKRYAGATGDVERATKLAIAANNAFIAGGMDDRQKLFTERQLLSLAGGAELGTNQWDSLRRNAPLAIRAVAKQMKMSVNDMITSLKEGKLSGQEFLDVFINVGTEGRLSAAAQKMKQTWDAVSQNISNAMNRMGAGLLESLDVVFEKTHGKSFLQYVLGVDANGNATGGGIKGTIDSISEAAQSWIKANPDKITGLIDSIASADWKGMASGFAQFGLTMGKIYGGLLKQFGGKGLVEMMLWGNMAGKGIQLAGGLTKGLAKPLSKLFTAFKFSETGRALKNAKMLSKEGKTLVGATRTVGSMALSWQSVAGGAIAVAAIPAMAWSLKEVAIAMQEFGKVDMSKLSLGKIGAAAGMVTAFGALAAALGGIITGTMFGKITALSTGVGLAAVAGISKTMVLVGKGLNAIANAEIPSADKVMRIVNAMDEIAKGFKAKNPFEALGLVFDSWAKSSEFKAVTNATQAFEGMSRLGEMKLSKNARKRMKKNFRSVMNFVKDLESVFDFSDEKEEEQAGTTTNATYRGNPIRKANYQRRLSSFMDTVSDLANGLGSMQSLITNANSLQRKYAKLSSRNSKGGFEFDWSVLKRQMQSIATGMYSLIEGGDESPIYKLKQVYEQTKTLDMENVATQLGKIPTVLAKLTKISGADTSGISETSLDTVGTTLARAIDKLKTALGTNFTSQVSMLSSNAGALKTGVGALKTAINMMNNLPLAKDMTSTVESVQTAIATLNGIGNKVINMSVTLIGKVDDGGIPQAIKDIADKIDEYFDLIKPYYHKYVSVSVTGEVYDNVSSKVESMVSTLRSKFAKTTQLIKKVNVTVSQSGNYPEVMDSEYMQRGGAVYRAGGGSIPRGTDTVNTWLTPGEFVLKRRAASALGHSLLYKLNNLDVRGALNELSMRVGAMPRSGIVNNTTNNNRNINVNMNNYGQDNTGRSRVSGWLSRL